MKITSRQNPKISSFRALTRDRKARLEAGELAIEGEKLFQEAVSSGLKPISVLITEKFSLKNNKFCEYAANLCNIDIISDDLGEYISDTKSPQGVFFTLPLLDKSVNLNTIISSAGKKRLILLDGLQDPGNVGTIIRSCDAFGADGLILSENSADINSPKVIRSAMGSAFRLPVCRGNLTELLLELKAEGVELISSVLNKGAEKLGSFVFPGKCCVIIGGEGAGISQEAANLCGRELYIPIKNAESLNAAVAASIIMYEML